MWSPEKLKIIIVVLCGLIIVFCLALIGVTVHTIYMANSYHNFVDDTLRDLPVVSILFAILIILASTILIIGTIIEKRTVLYVAASLLCFFFVIEVILLAVNLSYFSDISHFYEAKRNLRKECPAVGLIRAQKDLNCCGYEGPHNYFKLHKSCCKDTTIPCTKDSSQLRRRGCLSVMTPLILLFANIIGALCYIIITLQVTIIIMIFVFCDELKKEDDEIDAELAEEYRSASIEARKSELRHDLREMRVIPSAQGDKASRSPERKRSRSRSRSKSAISILTKTSEVHQRKDPTATSSVYDKRKAEKRPSRKDDVSNRTPSRVSLARKSSVGPSRSITEKSLDITKMPSETSRQLEVRRPQETPKSSATTQPIVSSSEFASRSSMSAVPLQARPSSEESEATQTSRRFETPESTENQKFLQSKRSGMSLRPSIISRSSKRLKSADTLRISEQPSEVSQPKRKGRAQVERRSSIFSRLLRRRRSSVTSEGPGSSEDQQRSDIRQRSSISSRSSKGRRSSVSSRASEASEITEDHQPSEATRRSSIFSRRSKAQRSPVTPQASKSQGPSESSKSQQTSEQPRRSQPPQEASRSPEEREREETQVRSLKSQENASEKVTPKAPDED